MNILKKTKLLISVLPSGFNIIYSVVPIRYHHFRFGCGSGSKGIKERLKFNKLIFFFSQEQEYSPDYRKLYLWSLTLFLTFWFMSWIRNWIHLIWWIRIHLRSNRIYIPDYRFEYFCHYPYSIQYIPLINSELLLIHQQESEKWNIQHISFNINL